MTQALEKNKILTGYPTLLKQLKDRIRIAQTKAALAVNEEMIHLYWDIGISVLKRQQNQGWGAKTLEKLSKDLRSSFPEMKGFSLRNIQYMVQFSKEFPNIAIVQQAVAQIPWGHNIVLLQKLDCSEKRLWYAQKTIQQGWSRAILTLQIESKLFDRLGSATTNFNETLPLPQSDLAHQALKDPYTFDFLTISAAAHEKELEQGLVDHIQQFLVELGAGFAFVGRQFPIHVEETDYFIDLLFYHYKLRCFCVIELKTTEFKPEHAGKMNFYLTAQTSRRQTNNWHDSL